MGIPQIVMIIFWSWALGIGITKHGKPKEGTENFFTYLISAIVEATLLIWGGFFKN
jgi:hypothetical protein